jgi:hypothetical protein
LIGAIDQVVGYAPSRARVATDAHEACLRVGLQPETDGFRTCLDNESYARSLMVPRVATE